MILPPKQQQQNTLHEEKNRNKIARAAFKRKEERGTERVM